MKSRLGSIACALALAAATLPAPAGAQPICAPEPPPLLAAEGPAPAPVPTPPGVRVDIPFAPPLGQTLRYRTRIVSWDDNRPEIVEMEFSLRFERNPDGYRMTLTPIPSERQRAEAPPAAAAFVERPMIFRVAADGAILAMIDEAAYWAAFDAAIAAARPALGGRDPVWEGAIAAALGAMRALPDAERASMLGALAVPVLFTAGLGLVTGEPLRLDRPVLSMFGRVPARVTYSLGRVQAGRASVATEADISPTDAEATFVRLISPALPQPPSPRVLRTTHQEEIEVSLDTGLALRSVARLMVEIEIGGECHRMRARHEVERADLPREVVR
jgi:hypothetical protein